MDLQRLRYFVAVAEDATSHARRRGWEWRNHRSVNRYGFSKSELETRLLIACQRASR